MARTLFLMVALLTPLAAAAEIYKWRDEQGRWHYGDEPRPGATRVDLPPVQVYDAPQTAAQPPAPPQPANEPAVSYGRVEIISPGPEATVRNATGEVGVAVALEPGLRPSHRVRLLMDGVPVTEPIGSTAFTLSNVDRGAHTLQVEVLNGRGDVIARAGPQVFYMHRPSRLN
jgi:hypothetical protein